jgi:hypothetical protein
MIVDIKESFHKSVPLSVHPTASRLRKKDRLLPTPKEINDMKMVFRLNLEIPFILKELRRFLRITNKKEKRKIPERVVVKARASKERKLIKTKLEINFMEKPRKLAAIRIFTKFKE